MECRGGLTVEEGAMMTTTESTSVPSGGVGKGDGDCDGHGDGDSDSGGDAFNNQQMLQAAIECRGGLTVEEGAMMTTTESTNVPFGGVGKGDGDYDGDGDGDSDSGGDAFNNQQMLQAAMEWRGGLTVEEGVMMTMTNRRTSRSGGDGDGDGEGDVNSGGGGGVVATATATANATAMATAMAMATATASAAGAAQRGRKQARPQRGRRFVDKAGERGDARHRGVASCLNSINHDVSINASFGFNTIKFN